MKTTTAKTFETSTTGANRTKQLFKKAKSYPRREEGNHQVKITDIVANGTDKIWFRLQGKFTDNGQKFEDFKEMYIDPQAEESEFTEPMRILIEQINNTYFPGEDYTDQEYEMFSKLIGQTITVAVVYNNQYTNYRYIPTQASEELSL